MCALLESLGVSIQRQGDDTLKVHASRVRSTDLDPDLCRGIRASILLAGPMVARSGELVLPPPGGDVIGRRRVDTHILALQKLGALIDYDRANYVFNFRAQGLIGNNILLD
jgi:UDP-N-acetylglucosamine 1-carboxyvinyltransferase